MRLPGRLIDRSRRIPEETAALYLAIRHSETPWHAKALAVLVVAYAASPIDLIPDFIPFLGWIDDLIIVPAGVALVIRLIPHHVMEECRREASPALLRAIRWIRRLGVGLILAIWLGIALAITLGIVLLLRHG